MTLSPRPALAHSSRSRGALFCAFLLCALSGGGLPVFAFPGAPVLELIPQAQCDGAGLFLNQIVSPQSSVPSQTVRLGNPPAFGQAQILTRAQISEMLRAAGPEWNSVELSGAAQIRVVRRARVLAERELRDLLTATLQQETVKDKGELELRFSRPWTGVYVPDENLVLKVLDLPASGVGPNFIVRFELLAGTERVGPWQVVAQARIMKDILIARTALIRGQPLREDDFTTERRDVLSVRDPVEATVFNNPSFELVESVPAGQPLLGRAVRLRPVVQRGQLIDGLVRDGTLNITLKVEVLTEGHLGQMIRVRNPKTKREFHAKIQNEQTVIINL